MVVGGGRRQAGLERGWFAVNYELQCYLGTRSKKFGGKPSVSGMQK